MSVRIGLVCVCMALSACARTAPLQSTQTLQVVHGGELPPPTRGDAFKLDRDAMVGPYDKLRISVYGLAELPEQTVQVDGAGRFAYPLAGSVAAAGHSTAAIAEEIESRLRAHHIRDPQVTVNVEESMSQVFTVDGQVKQPGMFPIVGHMTLIRAIASARGLDEFAKLDDVVVLRTVNGQRMGAAYNLGAIRRGVYADPEIYANDVVIVGDSSSRRLLRDFLQAAPLLTSPLYFLLR